MRERRVRARRRSTSGALLVLTLVAAALIATTAEPAASEVPGNTTDASITLPFRVTAEGTDLSADGNSVAFSSPIYANLEDRVFVRDMTTYAGRLASYGTRFVAGIAIGTMPINGTEPSISANGNRVAFTHQPRAAGSATEVRVFDQQLNRATVVYDDPDIITDDGLLGPLGPLLPIFPVTVIPGVRSGSQPAISDDGAYVAFVAEVGEGPNGHPSCDDDIDNDGDGSVDGRDLACLTNPGEPVVASSQVFVRRVGDPAPPTLVSHLPIAPTAVPGAQGGDDRSFSSHAPAISADGRRIVYLSDADLAALPGQSVISPVTSVWLWDRTTGQNRLISRTLTGAPADCQLDRDSRGTARHGVDISADGRYAVFACFNDDLVVGDGHPGLDTFVADLDTGTIELVSTTSSGAPALGPSGYGPELSADGRYVVFASQARNLLDGPDDGPLPGGAVGRQIYVRDRIGGRTTRVSLDDNGAELPVPDSTQPSISASGRYVAWTSGHRFRSSIGTTETSTSTTSSTTLGAIDGSSQSAVPLDVPCEVFGCGAGVRAMHRDRLPVLVLTPSTIDVGTVTLGANVPPITVTARNRGFGPFTIASITSAGAAPTMFAVIDDTCAAPLHFNDACTFRIDPVASAAGTFTADVVVRSDASNDPQQVRITMTVVDPPIVTVPREPPIEPPIVIPEPRQPEPVYTPTLEISPNVVRLGRVTMAEGRGWRPNSQVVVALDEPDPATGQPAPAITVLADDAGNFRFPISIPHRIEAVGPRVAVGQSFGGLTASDPYLVALPPVSASTSFVVRYRNGLLVLVPLYTINGTGPTNRTR